MKGSLETKSNMSRQKTIAWWMKLSLLLLCMIGMLILLSGCGSGNVYTGVTREIDESASIAGQTGPGGLSPSSYLLFVNKVKLYAPFIIAISISIGLVLGIITQNAKAVRKRVHGIFLIAIPIITFLFVYGISGLYARLFY